MRVHHDHRARDGLRVFHRLLKFALGDVLNLFVDRERDVVAGLGLLLNTAKPLLARIDRDHHAAWGTLQAVVILALYATESAIVGADVAQYLRGHFTLGVEALRLFLIVNAL